MILKNARVLNGEFVFENVDVMIEGEKIAKIAPKIEGDGVDYTGKTIIPGLIDIHTHACVEYDYCDADIERYKKMSEFEAENGITSVCATSMTLSEEMLAETFSAIASFKGQEPGAYIQGINMEGPYFSYEKRGAQNKTYLADPDYDQVLRLNEAAGGLIKIIDIAPETKGAMEFIKKAKDIATISIAHTNCKYEQAKEALDNGATHCTHCFNAMPAFAHREPGVIGAVLENDSCTTELITDGVHLHPGVVRMMFRIVGADRICMVSDSISATGMKDGEYQLGGQKVLVQNGKATLADGVTIAGATTTLMECVRRSVSFGVKLEDAVKASSQTPAKAIGVSDVTGSIVEGKLADIVVVDDSLNVVDVYIKGKKFVKNA